ncbi:MAG: beta-N-acetylhexosaminidase [Bacilli bacterium]
MSILNPIKIAIDYLGEENFSGFDIAYHTSDVQSLVSISKNDNKIDITYGSLSNLFRALTLIKEKKDENAYSVNFNQKFKTNGLMLDCSRNGVMKTDKVKEMILLSALMGHNRILLYTEDTYKLEKYPYFGYLRGAYSKEEIKDFVAYGEAFGVELVPCIQTLGHLYQALKWHPMAHLRDGADTLLADSEATYQFIEDAISFTRECFNSKDIHIGMDESTSMGLFRYLQLNGYKDRVETFSRHLTRVIEICKKHDFSPMIWSDMFFRLNNKDEEYYRDTPLPETTLKLIPKDVKLVYWDYYHNEEKTYLDMISFHKQAPNEVVFAGGSWRWKGYTPAIDISMQQTECALNACVKEEIKDVFITAWGDDGNECSFFTVLPVLAQASVYNFEGTSNEDAINSLLIALTGDSLADFKLMDLPDQPAKKKLTPSYNPSKYLLYQDPLLGVFDLQVEDQFAKNYADYATVLRKKATSSKLYHYIYELLANLCEVMSHKVDLGVRLRKAYKNKDKQALENIVIEVDTCITKFDAFHESVKKQWMIECKMFGYEVLDGRLGFLKNRIITAKERVLEFISNKCDRIEEFEEDILPFDGVECEVQWNWWMRNVSPSN